MNNKSYLYIRTNEWCELKEVYKVGITKSIRDRNNSYITGEIIRGNFIKIFELDINHNQLNYIDKIIKIKFKKLNVYIDGGTEFYKKEINDKIEEYLNKSKIKFKLVKEDELNRINRINRSYKNYNNQTFINIINNYIKKRKEIKPKEHQIDIINKIDDFYLNNDIGNLIWTCGLGKSLMSIFIIKKLNFKKIIIGVPTCFLQNQFANEILQIFPNENNILIISSNNFNRENFKKIILNYDNDNKDDNNNNQPLFIITTYHSCHLFLNNEFIFDFKIADECHHLVGKDKYEFNDEEKRRFIQFHKIKSIKSLYMTATKKTILNKDFNDDIYYSMDDEKIFGKTIDEKSFKWAIDKDIITNYKIFIIQNEFNELLEIKDKMSSSSISNKDLFIAVYLTLKSLTILNENSPSHLLIYTNEIKDADLAKDYIKLILSYDIINIDLNNLYYNSLHSYLNNNDIENGLKEFQIKKYGIICCVQLFGEGVNCPIIDGITIACNMNSEIRIVQYLLRANRKYYKKPNKIAYYIIPYLSNENYNNLTHIIRQLANVDDTIEQKIMVSSFINNNNNKNELDDINYSSGDEPENYKYEFLENPELLLKIKMKLRNSKDLICDLKDEENEYNYIKSINKYLNLSSRIDYSNSKEKHEKFIENPDKYFLDKGVWISWCDFLGYETSHFLQTKDKWLNFCKEKEIKTVEDYKKLSFIFKELPKNPEDFYNDFSNIESELSIIKIRRRR